MTRVQGSVLCSCCLPWNSVLDPPPCPLHAPVPLMAYPVVEVVTTSSEWPDFSQQEPDIAELAPIERDRFLHNVVAHPLLVLWPRLGRWLHDRTEP